ncbi:MAG TPA: hypothetical protein DCQ31_14755, partial [Bacteroidales bacterium]|nr:hypothetical protein [Bacteroidales bacterium]
EIQRLGNLIFSGNLTGYVDNFAAYGVLKTALGNIKSDITLSRPQKNEFTIDGAIETTNFNLAKLQNSKM